MKPALCAWVMLLLLLVPCAARAESERERQVRAVAVFKRGEEQFKAGHFDAAANLFQEAWSIFEDPAYILNIGLAYEKAERWGLALFWYDRFLAKYPGAPQVPDVVRRREAAEKSRAAVRATVMIRSEPPGARASVISTEDAPPSCVTPCELRVDPGPVALRVELGAASAERSKSLGPGERWDVSVPLEGVGPLVEARDRTPSWIAWGVGGGALVTGLVFAVMAQDSYDSAEALAKRSPLAEDDFRRFNAKKRNVRDQALVADIGFAGALVGATVGTVLWFTW